MGPVKTIKYAKRSVLSLLVTFLFTSTSFAQTAPPVQWKKSFGGTKIDEAKVVANTLDGGYIVTGVTHSADNDVNDNHVVGSFLSDDAWVIRLDSNGAVEWKKCYGGSGNERFFNVIATADSGFFFIGETDSYQSGDVTGKYPDTCAHCYNPNVWMVKTNSMGAILWEKSIGGSKSEYLRSLVQTPDGGFAFIGVSNSTDGDLTGINPVQDVWFVRINDTGKVLWQKTYGGSKLESPIELKKTLDNGFIFTSIADSDDGDVNDRQAGRDIWIVKLDSTGTMQWNKTYGGGKDDQGGASVIESIDGGYLFVSHPVSSDGDITANKGGTDIWMVRLNDTGKILWEKSFGGTGNEGFKRVIQTPDSGFVVAAMTASSNGDVTKNNGPYDWWILKANKSGAKVWQMSIGSTGNEWPSDIILARDGYVIAGYSAGADGDMQNIGYKGSHDFFVVKLKENFKPGSGGGTTSISSYSASEDVNVYPSPTNGVVYIELPKGYEAAQISLYDLQGRLVEKEESGVQKRSIDMSGLVPGTYTIQVLHNGLTASYKVVKK